jgi:hypothetical protein
LRRDAGLFLLAVGYALGRVDDGAPVQWNPKGKRTFVPVHPLVAGKDLSAEVGKEPSYVKESVHVRVGDIKEELLRSSGLASYSRASAQRACHLASISLKSRVIYTP